MKICSVCGDSKDESEYNKNKTKSDGLQTLCRDCSKKRSKLYYQQNKHHHIEKVRLKNKTRRDEARKFLRSKLLTGCVDCQESDLRVLEFDHIGSKEYDVAKMATNGYSLEKIEKEIEKCQVVCANCHRRRTYSRRPSWRSS